MAEPTITLWKEGTVVDDEPPPRRPLTLILATALALWILDLVLALTLPPRDAPPLTFDDASAARAELTAAAEAADAWLLVGDSVLAGDVMAGRVDGWERERVVDAMRREQGPASDAELFQVALDGLLPVDLLHLVRELDRVDPAGRVGLVVELNPRFFSPQYAALTACTRPWLCELGPETATPSGHVRWDSLALGVLTDLRDALAAFVPVYRHRRKLPALQPEPAWLLRPRADAGDPLAARARLLAHYRDLALDPDTAQMQALQQVVQRLRGVGRRALFFTTPIADEFQAQAQTPAETGAYTAAMSAIVEGDGSAEHITLVPLDDPGFPAQMFLDHCHLNPEGNRRLALNLLHSLGLGLRQRPRTEELVYPEGVDRTLVGRATQGHVDGPSWHALFNQPRGVAVAPGGRRVVVADSDNHALRELVGDLHSVRTLVGGPERQGWLDGPVSQARLDRPRAPWIAGEDVYFADQGGAALRRVRAGVVSTLRLKNGEFTRIDQIQGHGDDLLLLDAGRRVLRYNPRTGASRVLARAGGKHRIAAFASAPDGRLWLAERGGKIWQARVGTLARIGRRSHAAELVFPDSAPAYVPQRRGSLWPLKFAEVQLDHPVALTYVPRYDALLVADDVRARARVPDYHERIQLRLLDLEDRRMYPWIHTQVASSYIYWNTHADAYASTLHVGSLALEPESASLVYLERHRSRLLWLSDGLLATAKTSHTANITTAELRELMGNEGGIRTLERYHPEHYLLRRRERVPRRGPYTGMLLSSSMSTMSQAIGPYSLVRRLERHLQEALGTRDGVRFDLFHRAYSSPLLHQFLDGADRYTRAARPDVIFMETHNFNNKLFRGVFTDDRIRSDLQKLADFAARSDALVILFDNSGLISIQHDGLRASVEVVERAKTIARQLGMVVIELTDPLLPRSLGEGVWGSPPLKGAHSSPYAIDATAALLAERSYPLLAARFGPDRTPALLLRGGEAPANAADPQTTLVGAFAQVPADWSTLLPDVPGEAIQRDREADRAQLFVDLKVALGARREVDAAELERLAVASLYTVLVRDRSFADVTRASVRLAWFTRYDEYGAGVSTGASVALELELGRDELVERLSAAKSTHGSK